MRVQPFLSLLALLALGVALSLLTMIITHRQDIREHAAGVSCNHTGRVKNAGGAYTFATLHIDANGVLMDSTGCEVYLLGAEGKKAGFSSGQYETDTTDVSYADAIIQKVPI